jgi:hypothetical protein
MSERTAPALAKLDTLLPLVTALPASPARTQLVDEAEALKRAVAAFHMEAIRFRVYAVDRLIASAGDPPDIRRVFDELRHALEDAGFHTRSHASP